VRRPFLETPASYVPELLERRFELGSHRLHRVGVERGISHAGGAFVFSGSPSNARSICWRSLAMTLMASSALAVRPPT
jgi:hypothetical protein